MLDYFAKSKQQEINTLLLEQPKQLNAPWQGKRPGFSANLRSKAKQDGIAIIAEYKRASPSLGDINLNVTPEGAAWAYADAGAAAISVLTEETRFKGSLNYLQAIHTAVAGSIPLLRKDFLLHPVQVLDTARTPASALLLIVKLTPDIQLLQTLISMAEERGIDAVVEIFDQEDLTIARQAGASIIQVNARDLRNFKVDRNKALELACAERQTGHKQELWIAASGISQATHIAQSREAGFDAVLVGTSLMQHLEAGGNMRDLLCAAPEGPAA